MHPGGCHAAYASALQRALFGTCTCTFAPRSFRISQTALVTGNGCSALRLASTCSLGTLKPQPDHQLLCPPCIHRRRRGCLSADQGDPDPGAEKGQEHSAGPLLPGCAWRGRPLPAQVCPSLLVLHSTCSWVFWSPWHSSLSFPRLTMLEFGYHVCL